MDQFILYIMGFHSVGLRLVSPCDLRCLKGFRVQVRVPDFTELKAKETGERNAAGDQVKNNMRIGEDEARAIRATLMYLMDLSTMMTFAVIKTMKLVILFYFFYAALSLALFLWICCHRTE